MKMKLKTIFLVVLAVMLAMLPRAQATADNSATNSPTTNAMPGDAIAKLFGDPVLAKGDGFEIKQSQLDQIMVGVKATAAMRGQRISPDQLKLIQGQVLNRLIDIQLLLQQATPADKAAGKEQFENSLQELKTKQKLTDADFDQKLATQLQLQNITRAEWEKQNIDQTTIIAVLKRVLGVNITDTAAKAFYDAHSTDFEQPEMVHVRHILLMTIDPTTRAPLPPDQQQAKRKQIEDILKRARAGEDFATLAKEYSEDPGSKDNGGELPPFSRGQMVPEFEAAAFALTNSQISDVVTTVYGYHIIKLLDKTPAKTIPFTGVDTLIPDLPNGQSATIQDFLTQQAIQKGAPEYLEGLRKKATVKILDPDLKAVIESESTTNAPPADE
jgi:parvulin-like peptidyl-prolyl isomerase